MKIYSKISASSIALIFLFGTSLNVQAQFVTSNSPSITALTNAVLYATDFKNSVNNNYLGTAPGTFTYTSSSGQLVYTNTGPSQWATLTTGQDGWVNTTQQGGSQYGPGVIYYNAGIASRPNPYLNVLGGDAYFSTDYNNSVTYPQSQTTYMAQTHADTPYNQIHFDTTFWIYASTPNSDGNWDTLGWSLLNNSGQNLLNIKLNTYDDGETWQLSATPFGSTNSQVLTKANGTALESINNNQKVHLGFNIYNIGEVTTSVQVLNYSLLTGTNIPTIDTNYTVLGTTILTNGNSIGLTDNRVSSVASTGAWPSATPSRRCRCWSGASCPRWWPGWRC
jgi:hypothetical protein